MLLYFRLNDLKERTCEAQGNKHLETTLPGQTVGAEQKVEVVKFCCFWLLILKWAAFYRLHPERWLLSTCFSFLACLFLLPCQSVEKEIWVQRIEDMFLFTLPPQGMINMKNVMGFVREKESYKNTTNMGIFVVKMKLHYRISQW